jgi:hypothetical protein
MIKRFSMKSVPSTSNNRLHSPGEKLEIEGTMGAPVLTKAANPKIQRINLFNGPLKKFLD